MGSLLLALRGQGNAVAQSGVKVSGLASSGNRGTCLVAMHYWCRGLYVRGAFPCSEVGRRGWVWVWVPIVPTSGCFYLLHYLPRCSHLVLPPLAPPTCGKRLFSLQCLCFFAGHLFSSICKHPAIFFPSLLSKLQFEFSFSFVFHPTSESDTWAPLLFVGYFLTPPPAFASLLKLPCHRSPAPHTSSFPSEIKCSILLKNCSHSALGSSACSTIAVLCSEGLPIRCPPLVSEFIKDDCHPVISHPFMTPVPWPHISSDSCWGS